jgi:hypothetical protein
MTDTREIKTGVMVRCKSTGDRGRIVRSPVVFINNGTGTYDLPLSQIEVIPEPSFQTTYTQGACYGCLTVTRLTQVDAWHGDEATGGHVNILRPICSKCLNALRWDGGPTP